MLWPVVCITEGQERVSSMKNDSMDNLLNEPGDYRIEISGWGLDNGFLGGRRFADGS
jgi:hypothetical protein